MKKIINGKLYNTETAERIGRWGKNLPGNDFNYCQKDLYRKKTGEFFLAVDFYGGERITPLTEAEAREWVENHLDADKYIAIFGEVEE